MLSSSRALTHAERPRSKTPAPRVRAGEGAGGVQSGAEGEGGNGSGGRRRHGQGRGLPADDHRQAHQGAHASSGVSSCCLRGTAPCMYGYVSIITDHMDGQHGHEGSLAPPAVHLRRVLV